MIALLAAVLGQIRKVMPVGEQSERQQWRHEMEAVGKAAEKGTQHNEARLQHLSIQGRIAGDYRPEGGD